MLAEVDALSEKPLILQQVDVWKAYDNVQALRGLELEILRGETFGLVGPNGAGKTTAMKIIVGLLKMDRGFIKVGEFDIKKNPYEYKRLIGYVPDTASLPDYLTIREFLTYVGKIRSVAADEIVKKAALYLKIFDLEDKSDSLILSLSRGMKQKTAMAAALIHDPDLLILDEPFFGIDPVGQRVIKNLFNERVEKGKSIFISTHMLDTAERMCDRVAIIHEGRKIASGNMRDLHDLSKTGEGSTLEEVFLKLTQESTTLNVEEAPKQEKRRRLFIFGGRS